METPNSAVASTGARICVYCGSSRGNKPEHLEMARSLARAMAAQNIGLVYGGGTVGIMGELAKTLVSLSGPDSVQGIIPQALVRHERDGTYDSSAPLTEVSSNTLANGFKVPEAPAAHGEGSEGSTGQSQEQQQQQPLLLPVPTESVYGRTTIVRDMHTRKALMAKMVMESGPGSGFIALSGGYGTMEELMETITWNQLGIHDKPICVLNVNGYYDGLMDWINRTVEEGFVCEENKRILAWATSAEEALTKLRDYQKSKAVFNLEWDTL